MDKYGYSGDPKFSPLSPWAYFGYSILFAIPVIGFIILIVLSFNDSNINRRNFARSFFCILVIVIVFIAACLVLGGSSAVFASLTNQ